MECSHPAEKSSTMTPSQIAENLTIGSEPVQQLRLTLFGTSAGQLAPNAKVDVSAQLRFSGAQRIALLAYGKTTRLNMRGDWADPSFDGGFLPVSRVVTPSGFRAEWTVPFIARGVRAEGVVESIHALDATALGASFVELADPYQSVNRSLKYVLLFLGLLFLTYFIFEVTTGKRVHPAQYLLVGIAQIIFYLLLLSLSERIGFGYGFLAAGAATVILLAINAGWIFASKMLALRALVVFTLPLRAHLHAAQARRQRFAGRSDCELPRCGCRHVPHAFDRLVRIAAGNFNRHQLVAGAAVVLRST